MTDAEIAQLIEDRAYDQLREQPLRPVTPKRHSTT